MSSPIDWVAARRIADPHGQLAHLTDEEFRTHYVYRAEGMGPGFLITFFGLCTCDDDTHPWALTRRAPYPTTPTRDPVLD